jgi:hypothetical protein
MAAAAASEYWAKLATTEQHATLICHQNKSIHDEGKLIQIWHLNTHVMVHGAI